MEIWTYLPPFSQKNMEKFGLENSPFFTKHLETETFLVSVWLVPDKNIHPFCIIVSVFIFRQNIKHNKKYHWFWKPTLSSIASHSDLRYLTVLGLYPLFQNPWSFLQKIPPLFWNPWTMEGIKKHPLSPWIYSRACIPNFITVRCPG